MFATLVDNRGWLLLFGLAAIAVPIALAGLWVRECSAWAENGESRCKNRRPGFMARCQHHSDVLFTAYDWSAAFAVAVAVFNAVVLMGALAS